MMLVPLTFLHPLVDGPAGIPHFPVESVQVLVVSAPPAIGPVHDVDHPGPVSLVGVVVDTDEVAPLIEGNLLGVAEASVHNLEVGSVGIKAENRALVGIGKIQAFPACDIHGAVADRSIKPPVRTQGESIEIVTGQGDTEAETGEELFPCVGNAVVIGVAEGPDVRDAGEVDLTLQRVDATCRAVEHPVEPFGVDAVPVGLPVSIGVDKEADFFRLFRHRGNRIFPVPLLMHPAAVFHGEGSDVVGVPVAVIAVVGDAVTEAVSLGYEDSPGLVDTEGGRRVNAVFSMSGEYLEPTALWNSDARQGVGAHQSGIEGAAVPGGAGKGWIGLFSEEDVVDQDIVTLPGRGID